MYRRDFNDHEFAAYLRAENAMDNCVSMESPAVNEFYRNGRLIAVAAYDNVNCTRIVYTYNNK